MKRFNEDGFTPPVDSQQAGFIPMLIMLLVVMIALIAIVYLRVLHAHK